MKIRNKIFLIDFIFTLFLIIISIPFVNLCVDVLFDSDSKGQEVQKQYKQLIYILISFFILVNRGIGSLISLKVLKPIQEIFNALREFKEGEEEFLPPISMQAELKEGDSSRLALTLNALTKRVRRQIKNLTKQREDTEKILESLGEGVIAFDPSTKITFANSIACRMLKVSQDNILGSTLDATRGGLLEKCHQMILHALQTSESISYKWVVREKTGLYLELISSPLAHQDGALLVLQDKTSDYRIIEMGKDFVANASHELRTPITIIRGFAETLQDVPNLAQEMQEEITSKIVKTCGRLDKLVRGLLTLADVENLPLDRFKQTDLIPLIENCVHLIKTSSPTTKIELNTNLEKAMIIADADLLELAIINILENSIKYSKQPARIEISIQENPNGLKLALRDRGIGMSEADLGRIFDRFYTIDKARSRKSGGAGLGLSIVKTIMDKHQGNIDVQSNLGKGSVFTFILPLSPKQFRM